LVKIFTTLRKPNTLAKSLSPRIKKLILLAVLVPSLVIYLFAAVILADLVPNFWLAKLIYFVIAGLLWAFPMKKFMLWANRT